MGSIWTAAKTIAGSFLGIRRRAEHDADAQGLSPVRIVIAGVVGAAIFVVGLVALVKFIVASAS